MSNFKKKIKFFFKIADNLREFYKSLDYHQKRLFQKLIFPEGFRFSMKNKECRTQKMNLFFDLGSSFANKYNKCEKETQAKKLLESHLVAGTGLEPVSAFGGYEPYNTPLIYCAFNSFIAVRPTPVL